MTPASAPTPFLIVLVILAALCAAGTWRAAWHIGATSDAYERGSYDGALYHMAAVEAFLAGPGDQGEAAA